MSPVTTRLRPHGGLLVRLVPLYALLLPVQIQLADDFRFAPADLVLVAIIALEGRRLRVIRGAGVGWPMALLALILGSLTWVWVTTGSITEYALLNKAVGMGVLVASYLAVSNAITSWEDVRAIIRVFVFGVAISNALFVMMFLSGVDTLIVANGARLSGLLVDPNAYGGLLVVAISLSLPNARNTLKLSALSSNAVMGSLFVGLLLTSSRSAWLGLSFALIILAILRPRVLFWYLVLAALLVYTFSAWLGEDFVSEWLGVAARVHSIDQRLVLNSEAWNVFLEHPIVGSGLGTFRANEGAIIHNTPLWILAEFGVVGFAIFGGFIGWSLRISWRLYKRTLGSARLTALGLLLANLVMLGLSLGIEALYQRHWWLVIALVGGAQSLYAGQPTDRWYERGRFADGGGERAWAVRRS